MSRVGGDVTRVCGIVGLGARNFNDTLEHHRKNPWSFFSHRESVQLGGRVRHHHHRALCQASLGHRHRGTRQHFAGGDQFARPRDRLERLELQ